MKVLDLQCSLDHHFEGWFASEQDFLDQHKLNQIECPACGDATITKKLSAPRLNLIASRQDCVQTQAPSEQLVPQGLPNRALQESLQHPAPDSFNGISDTAEFPTPAALAKAWMAVSQKMIAGTVDVGARFAEEARKIHYGETEARAIRGQTSAHEARALLEEGIDVMPLLLPESAKSTLQ